MKNEMVEIESAIKLLVDNDVEFVVIGGVALIYHGCDYSTQDLDFCYRRTKENLKKIVRALSDVNPRPRGFPEGLPFIFDESTLQNGTNFTFITSIGDIDMLGEVPGVGTYEDTEKDSVIVEIEGAMIKVLSIDDLIKAKTTAGRKKDLLVLPELEALKEIQDKMK